MLDNVGRQKSIVFPALDLEDVGSLVTKEANPAQLRDDVRVAQDLVALMVNLAAHARAAEARHATSLLQVARQRHFFPGRSLSKVAFSLQ